MLRISVCRVGFDQGMSTAVTESSSVTNILQEFNKWTTILKRFILAFVWRAQSPRSRSACENPPTFFSSALSHFRIPHSRPGFQISSQQPADSRSGLFEPERSLGRRLQAVHSGGSQNLARGHYPLAEGTPHPHRLWRFALRSACAEVDAVEFHAAADDGAG